MRTTLPSVVVSDSTKEIGVHSGEIIGLPGGKAASQWSGGQSRHARRGRLTLVPASGKEKGEAMGENGVSGCSIDLDIDALLSQALPPKQPSIDILGIIDRQIAREVAMTTEVTTLLLMGRLSGPRCLPVDCDTTCSSFKLISMRTVGQTQIAMFSVPRESEMAELFEELDGRRGIHAIAYDRNGRTKEAYVL